MIISLIFQSSRCGNTDSPITSYFWNYKVCPTKSLQNFGVISWLILSEKCYTINTGRNLNCSAVMMDGKGENSEIRRLNKIILIAEMNPLHINVILFTSDARTYAACCLKWPPTLATQKRACFKTRCFTYFSRMFCMSSSTVHDAPLRVHLVSAISPDAPSPSRIPTNRNQGVSSLAKGVTRHANSYDQSNNFHSTNSNTVWLSDQKWGGEASCCSHVWSGLERNVLQKKW
jgi:hypothetical protein